MTLRSSLSLAEALDPRVFCSGYERAVETGVGARKAQREVR